MDFTHEPDRIYLKDNDGKIIAEVTFPKTTDDIVNIDHTYVDRKLQGQGVAGKLLTELMTDLRNSNKKATATCSYAIDWFKKHPENDDLYID